MQEMTGRERIERSLRHQDVDRVATFESFWPDTAPKWVQQGRLRQGEDPRTHFDLDLRECWAFNYLADLDFKEQVVEETEDTRLVRNGNGALLRWWKKRAGTPEHVDFLVQDRDGWEKHIRPFLTSTALDRRRINFEGYRRTRDLCRDKKLFFCWSGINVFECMHPVCGHEYMLMGMAMDPDWVRDMCQVYTDLNLRLMDILFAEEGEPDAIWYYEDMGFKERPFMSPQMYRDIIFPSHKRSFDYAHNRGKSVIVHSCGFVEPLIPGLVEAGMDCLQAMEVKAGMDLLRIKKTYGGRIALFGGMDIRALETNDPAKIDAELAAKLAPAMAGGGYILHTDHSIPPSVEYATYKYFVNRAREMSAVR